MRGGRAVRMCGAGRGDSPPNVSSYSYMQQSECHSACIPCLNTVAQKSVPSYKNARYVPAPRCRWFFLKKSRLLAKKQNVKSGLRLPLSQLSHMVMPAPLHPATEQQCSHVVLCTQKCLLLSTTTSATRLPMPHSCRLALAHPIARLSARPVHGRRTHRASECSCSSASRALSAPPSTRT